MSDAIDHHLTVTIGGKQQKVFFSFGLVASLARLVGAIENVPALDYDPDLAQEAVRLCLMPRDDRGVPTDPDFVSPVLDVETAEALLNAIGEHVFDFFLSALARGSTRLARNAQRLQDLGASLSSTPNSPSQTLSASPSTPLPAESPS